ncbi:hypothetical protein EDB19DRAFT_1946282 [Suillus lakei]|nr:hypothetical protein EDB19DRAFT_1946282 [Suillus lakei]
MPRALLISEILSNIISYISVDERPNFWPVEYVASSAPTLFSLALTCRAFLQQALDALWHTLISIEPLMRCAGIIPAPQKRLQEENDYPIAKFNRSPVRSLEVGMGCWRRNHHVESFLRTLACSLKVLVPNLRSLEIAWACELLHLVTPPLGPRLQHLLIGIRDCEKDDHHSHTVIQSLHSSCPSLESLTVFESNRLYDTRHAPFVLPVSHAIQKMPKLRTVTVPAITKDAPVYLGGLASFTDISSRLPTGSDLKDILDSSRGPILFENVDNVKFDPSLLQALFDSLHTREAFKNLQCIHLSDPRWARFLDIPVITIDTIRPLFYLRHLRVVDIDTKRCLSIGANDLAEMAEAWPCLEVLFLNKTDGSMSGWAPMPVWVTLSGVISLVELYPCLKELHISITLCTVDDDYDMEEASLRALEPRNSDSRLETLMMRYPRGEEDVFEDYFQAFPKAFSSGKTRPGTPRYWHYINYYNITHSSI